MAPMPQPDLERRIAAVRHFNRFYTQRIGVLREGWAKSPFSLAEARVLYELSRREQPTASALAADLGLDAGYLSRILRGFGKRGLVSKRTSQSDGRQNLLSLTTRGRRIFAPIERRACAEIEAMLGRLSEGKRGRLSAAMQTIEDTLGPEPASKVPYILRPPEPGDMGWIVSRHGTLYRREYGWDERFEALIAEIVAGFLRHYDPKRERCWIAERNGETAGCVLLVKQSARVARLRLLLVEPEARGLGIGGRLVVECIRFARQAGYRKITLWTHDFLYAARYLYEQAGFRLIHSEPHRDFGDEVIGETWELTL
jgi:DNA-binding MarR family transcriptional regulator/GNAT superfamily N-acetyltransferase